MWLSWAVKPHREVQMWLVLRQKKKVQDCTEESLTVRFELLPRQSPASIILLPPED
jgi:hypothetical protein